MTLRGKIAVVTGASRGIGKGVALALGEAGATVYVTGRTVEKGTAPLPGTIGATAPAHVPISRIAGRDLNAPRNANRRTSVLADIGNPFQRHGKPAVDDSGRAFAGRRRRAAPPTAGRITQPALPHQDRPGPTAHCQGPWTRPD